MSCTHTQTFYTFVNIFFANIKFYTGLTPYILVNDDQCKYAPHSM